MLSILPSSQIQIEKQGVLHHQRREPFHADISGVFSAPADTFTPTVKTTPLPFFGRIIKLDELENPREYPFKSRIEGTSPLRHYWNLFLSGTITAGVDPTKFWIDADTLRTMKPVGFYSVLANKLPADVKTILDPFAGGGGSAIGFALGGKHVIANDLDPDKVAMLKHNARLFQFPTSRLSIIQGDAKELLSTVKADCLHLDPPWGGFFS
jgi:tRNA G26 N,N-dimethylase Trm1